MAYKVKVVGATGYGGIGIIDLLLRHPETEIVSLTASTTVNKPLSDYFPHLRGLCDLIVQKTGKETDEEKPDVVFLATPNGVAMKLAATYLDEDITVIDFSGDFRLKDLGLYKQYYGRDHVAPVVNQSAVYGLPELHRKVIRGEALIANPGCFAATSLLALAPAVEHRLVQPNTIIIDAKSGVSGAGKKPTDGHHFPSRNENLNAYKIVAHQHTPEIEQELSRVAQETVTITFVPQVAPMTRGILVSAYASLTGEMTAEQVRDVYREHYKDEPFVRIAEDGECAGVLPVRGSNFCDLTINVDPRTSRVIVIACIDNLMKGQAGNALQNMNLALGLDETLALLGPPLYP